ncbi:MAG: HAMP domain-containing histidine kinase [Geminocystis sp.]|nr:HAMP domain-containing histidine kinase [Geminocystis sp.]HIK38186.1 HAMP domain-containing histidine kinase [Geminocystis sp. M7585_C2015_104]MCS7148676.1 HAMP domain-containing histidine kinase [Geminocystis sp.]MCX8078206.1 HAMP domain-containing histidine kinase [Geminocystis sp.]MDW8115092.1 HAMP domain-containing sensor histidine kinase [Geminocystis sp.]
MRVEYCRTTSLMDLINEQEWEDLQYSDMDDSEADSKAQESSIQVYHEWNGAVASLERLLLLTIGKKNTSFNPEKNGFIISSPTPVINNWQLIPHLHTVVLSPKHTVAIPLLPSGKPQVTDYFAFSSSFANITIPEGYFLQEQFCLVFTDSFSLFLIKGIRHNKKPAFFFSFNPEIIHKVWGYLRRQLMEVISESDREGLERISRQLKIVVPEYIIVEKFSRGFVESLKRQRLENPKEPEKIKKDKINRSSISLKKTPIPPYPELELLQALTHEIRTPLTTIKTLARLLGKKAKKEPELLKYIEKIEQECTEQINRMELIFKAVELESQNKKETLRLIPTSLETILNQTVPYWQRQAERRNIVLEVFIPQKLPQIISEPAILSQVLNGLMEKFIRGLPSGCRFKMLVLPAGNQLKLKFSSEVGWIGGEGKSLGRLLFFQPETGSLSLSDDVTKNIFQALGGKLTIKQKPNGGEIVTIFLPLGSHTGYPYCSSI